MAISLTKGQKISLEKEAGSTLTRVIMGVGWDPAQSEKKGFLSKLLSTPPSIDLDASCIVFDENKNILDAVYFGQLKSQDNSIIHTGDNLTGDGDGDDEQINVDLSKLSSNVKSIIFTVNSFRGQTFNEVANAYCRLLDGQSGNEVARITLSGGGNHTAMIMAKVYLHNGEWKMHAIGEPTSGKTIQDIATQVASYA